MNKYTELVQLKKGSAIKFEAGDGEMALCPDLGGRVFAELGGRSLHRIDLDTVAAPTRDFNNYGGLSFWPAPEGGKFGFNYKGDEWYVQKAINSRPFEWADSGPSSAAIRKRVVLVNRAGTQVEVVMTRELKPGALPEMLLGKKLQAWMSYLTTDSFQVVNNVSTEEALIASWTLEQFDASDDTMAFVSVEDSKNSINFDFYEEHPGERIAYYPGGFTYKTDGRAVGQIGIRKSAGAGFIGFFDLSAKLLCIRQNLTDDAGLYFNFADNDQPEGPYSAADNYSIYNSAPEGRFFEIETIGAAEVKDGELRGSELLSSTTFAFFDSQDDLRAFLSDWIYKED